MYVFDPTFKAIFAREGLGRFLRTGQNAWAWPAEEPEKPLRLEGGKLPGRWDAEPGQWRPRMRLEDELPEGDGNEGDENSRQYHAHGQHLDHVPEEHEA